MARNVEIKARVAELSALERRVAGISDAGPEVLIQDDTFFNCPVGRLKLRAFPHGAGELIAYARPDVSGPSTCHYSIAAVGKAAELAVALTTALGIAGRIQKERRLYLMGPTRIHLDRVAGLGTFLELEVVLRADQDAAEGEAQALALMTRLGVERKDLVDVAYVDL
jgi:predicted adenylyl cyclase CyaB